MSGERVERRLAAILAVDVAGYSRLMGADEEGTHAAMLAVRREVGDPKIREHRGRIVKTTGDGLLVEFASVVDAVRCAVEVQREMIARNTDVPIERRLEFRMGINVGDIIIEDGDIFGDGVNIAARLEALAEPGGICVSAAAHEQVRDRLDISFDELGDQQVKNITRPVRVFSIGSRTSGPLGQTQLAPTTPTALPLPDKPSIAVLPFQNMSGDPEQEYFVDGIVEDIITGLSRIKWLYVIARNSTFVYKGRAIDVKQAGRELGVRYVLEGSLRKAGNRVRVTAQLIEADSGTHVWAERYDRPIGDIFDLQDELTLNVIGAIEPSLRQAEIERAKRKRPENLDAYDLYLRAQPFAQVAMPGDAGKALALLDQALALEPDYAAAHASAAWCYEQRYMRGGLRAEDKIAGLHHARAAIEAGADDAAILATAGFCIGLIAHDYPTAMEVIDRGLSLAASSALGLSFGSVILSHAGEADRAIDYAERALRSSPPDFMTYLSYTGLALAHYVAGRFAESATAGGRAAQANPRFSYPQVVQAAALVQANRTDEAQAVARRVLEIEPSFTVAEFVQAHSGRAAIWVPMGDALRQIGLP
jgi:TolB-like protein/class 3 adenylate cyclase/tetratricopeptide (TPR) repeat protein